MVTTSRSSSRSNSVADDEDDRDYSPEASDSPPIATDIYSTPLKRAHVQSLSQYIKNEIDAITCTPELSMKRCIIENIEEINAVQYAHILSRSTTDPIMLSLEYSWGLKPGHLNVDSRFNIFRLNSRLHHAFDRGLWLLLPSPSVVTQFENHKKRGPRDNTFMELCREKALFKYTLVPHMKMKAIPIHRQVDSSNRPVAPKAEDFTHYRFPFHKFPTIISHVHPRYVIFNTGKKLSSDLNYDLRYKDELAKVRQIYEAWIKPAPPLKDWETEDDNNHKKGDEDGKPNNEDEDNASHTSYHTRSARWDAPPSDDGAGAHTGSPPSKRARTRGKGMSEFSETLIDFDDTSEPISHEKKKARIMSWAEDVARESDLKVHSLVLYGPAAIEDHNVYDNFTLFIGVFLTVWHSIWGILIISKAPTVVAEPEHAEQVVMNGLYL
ncbi:hypothetical protein CPB84DRAFT_1847201 [Gymnopilus junonius]|uniref:HNH nuclease domain-containing protein n=1 Tax=Gymnopilus junonius TaxID=109634 RepID=A0A9P5TN39_GYMJU|nr:hypothetical protein CPB84DRAFT_1847201 [Gymnopilus junonius]